MRSSISAGYMYRRLGIGSHGGGAVGVGVGVEKATPHRKIMAL
jgi:hypothetical protein